MFVANTGIVIGKKTFQKGQTVTGLSSLDRKWMIESGYISEVYDSVAGKKDRKAQKPDLDSQTERRVEDEFQGSVSG